MSDIVQVCFADKRVLELTVLEAKALSHRLHVLAYDDIYRRDVKGVVNVNKHTSRRIGTK